MHTFTGIFNTRRNAARAVAILRQSTLTMTDLSIITRAPHHGVTITSSEDVSAYAGARVGAVWGGAVGLAALLILGVGTFIAGGALAVTLIGVVTGAIVGGIAAALIHFGGISKEEAHRYEALVNTGKTLVVVKANVEDARHVHRMMGNADATGVRDSTTDSAILPQPLHGALADKHD